MESRKKIAGIVREYPFISVLSYLLAQGLGCMGMFYEVLPPVVGFLPSIAVGVPVAFMLLIVTIRREW